MSSKEKESEEAVECDTEKVSVGGERSRSLSFPSGHRGPAASAAHLIHRVVFLSSRRGPFSTGSDRMKRPQEKRRSFPRASSLRSNSNSTLVDGNSDGSRLSHIVTWARGLVDRSCGVSILLT